MTEIPSSPAAIGTPRIRVALSKAEIVRLAFVDLVKEWWQRDGRKFLSAAGLVLAGMTAMVGLIFLGHTFPIIKSVMEVVFIALTAALPPLMVLGVGGFVFYSDLRTRMKYFENNGKF